MVPVTVMFGVLADAVISQNGLTAGSYANKSVTFTQAMFNAIANQVPASELSNVKSAIGQSETLSAITYSTSGSGSLPNSVSITTSGQTVTYKWSSDRKNVQISMTLVSNSTTYNLTVAYDGTDGSGAFKLSDGTNTFQLSLAPNASSTADGASVSLTASLGTTESYSIYGYADDSGGITYSTITPTTVSWEEGFDGTGTLVFQVTASSISTLAAATDSYSSSSAAITEATCKSSYGTKASAASSLSAGATALLSL